MIKKTAEAEMKYLLAVLLLKDLLGKGRITKRNNSSSYTRKDKSCSYCRVSSKTDEQLNSLFVQKKYFDELFASHSDWTNVGIYYDEGISKLNIRKQDGFNKMVEDALAGKINLIIVKSILTQ